MNGHHNNSGGHHGFGQGQHGKSEGGYCICLQCGFSVTHQPGIPCKSIFCPDCKISLVRSDIPGNKSAQEQKTATVANPVVAERKILYPKVVAEKCTACGACIDICPTGTIVMADGKAFVEIDNCRNCKICMRACPENAFIVE
jgi:Na+-translocating ferredoxin:NAD+ oxidoreductase subunit B